MNHGVASSPLPFRASSPQYEIAQDAPALSVLYAPAAIVIAMGAFALRLVMLDRFPFREDEAAYAYWALHGWLEDPMFLQIWPDKPPIYLWILGGAFRLFGVSEAGARWVNVAASTLTVPIVAASARRLWGNRAALVAATVLALSPYAISYGPTAYTDPVLVLAGMAALCAATYGRPLAAGLLLGAAVMTKQQGVLFAPLVIGGLWVAQQRLPRLERSATRSFGLLVAGTALTVLPILYWDSLRWAVAPSPWDLSVRNYATVHLLAPEEWLARAALWAPHVFDLTASWVVWSVWAGLIVAGIVAAQVPARNAVRQRSAAAVVLIAGWSLLFLAVHVVTTIQPWDRYILPLAPMLALIAAWAVSRIGLALPGVQAMMLAVMGVLLLVSPGQQAANGRLAVGGDHGDYAGLTDAIRSVEHSTEGPMILYHRVLGTHYRFYLYDRARNRSQSDSVDLRWFPSPVYLADNAAKSPFPRKFLIVPDWAPMPNLESHLAMRGLAFVKLGRFGRFTVWEIGRETAPYCTWCMSRQPSAWHESTDAQKDATLTRP